MNKGSPVILVRADASSAIGSGHVMRCLALGKAWKDTGGTLSWVSAQCIPVLEERIRREGITYTRTQSVPGLLSDAAETIAEARRVGAAWVVVDGYRFKPDYVRVLKKNGLRVLFIDDDGRFESYAADVVLNQNLSATSAMYPNREALTRLLLGPDYVLLRPEFFGQSPRGNHATIGRKILITMGGSDPENVTERVFRATATLDIDIQVVIGGGNPRRDTLPLVITGISPSARVEQSPENMAPLMNWADVAISAAGSTCWELAYMGVPAIVIAISSDQRGIAQSLGEQGIALSLGWHANLSEEAIREALVELLHEHQRRIEMSERGRKLIDGRGAVRVVEFLQKSL
jgi:UDP-2,4-diacetamido-2,4,6-trideoxy-beta-L-altropyranose hydrolase